MRTVRQFSICPKYGSSHLLASIFRVPDVLVLNRSAGGDFRVLAVPVCPAVAAGGGVPRARGLLLPRRRDSSGWSAGWEGLQPVTAAVISPTQGHRAASLSRRRRPTRARRPATENRRSRSRLGSQRRAVPVRASIWVQARSSQARATISHHSWFWAKPCRGRASEVGGQGSNGRSPLAGRDAATRGISNVPGWYQPQARQGLLLVAEGNEHGMTAQPMPEPTRSTPVPPMPAPKPPAPRLCSFPTRTALYDGLERRCCADE